MTLTDELRAIEERAAKASAGPWEVLKPDMSSLRPGGRCDGIAQVVPRDEYGHVPHEAVIVETDGGYYAPSAVDASFIAAARTDVPVLVEMVKLLTDRYASQMHSNRMAHEREMDELWAEAKQAAARR
jgi:hypothetical protein